MAKTVEQTRIFMAGLFYDIGSPGNYARWSFIAAKISGSGAAQKDFAVQRQPHRPLNSSSSFWICWLSEGLAT
jgi:hypothetical protein